MSQQEILMILEQRKNRWFTSNELAEMTGVTRGSITTNLKRLREREEVRFSDSILFIKNIRMGFRCKHKA